MRPLRKTGRIMVMSNRCPVPNQGSLVTMMSPGFSVSAGKRFSMCRAVTGALPMKAGMPNVPCAMELHSASSTTHDRS